VKKLLSVLAILLLTAAPALAASVNHFEDQTSFSNSIQTTPPPPDCATGTVLEFVKGHWSCIQNITSGSCPPDYTLIQLPAGNNPINNTAYDPVTNPSGDCVPNYAVPPTCPAGQAPGGITVGGAVAACVDISPSAATMPICTSTQILQANTSGTLICTDFSRLVPVAYPTMTNFYSTNGIFPYATRAYDGTATGGWCTPNNANYALSATAHIINTWCSCFLYCQGQGFDTGEILSGDAAVYNCLCTRY